MIDAKALVALLRRGAPDNHRCFGCGYENHCGVHGCRIMREAADRIEEMVRCAAWIRVEDKLPESFRPVIVCREKRKGEYIVEQGVKDVGDWWKVYGVRTKHVTHWMPLPEPPKEEHEKEEK